MWRKILHGLVYEKANEKYKKQKKHKIFDMRWGNIFFDADAKDNFARNGMENQEIKTK